MWKVGANLRPLDEKDLDLNANYTSSRIVNAISSFPAATAEIEAAFPDRFQRDSDGRLLLIDTPAGQFRPLDRSELRWGINLSLPIGPQPQPGQGRGRFGRGGGPGAAGAPGRRERPGRPAPARARRGPPRAKARRRARPARAARQGGVRRSRAVGGFRGGFGGGGFGGGARRPAPAGSSTTPGISPIGS